MSVKLFYGGQSLENSRTQACSEIVFHFVFPRWIIIPQKVLVHVNTNKEVNLQRRGEIN